jgi:acyl-[acyl-carrier-protein] desaturase
MVSESPALTRLEQHVTDYLRQNDHVGYNRFEDFDWASLKDSVVDSGLTDVQIGAVETAMLVEDHIPGYGQEYTRIFMVHEGRTDEEAWMCRQMLHFVFRWLSEEDRHAHCLELWLRHSGKRDSKALTDLMVCEGKKHYIAPSDNPTQLFTYTAIQEKATQLYYSALRQSVEEPILRSVLAKLAQDEARHCHFFSQMVRDALEDATTRQVAEMKETLEQFSMPLATMMDNYIRKAIQMKRAAVGYDFREALQHFQRIVTQVVNTRTTSRGGNGNANLQDLLVFVQGLQPEMRRR